MTTSKAEPGARIVPLSESVVNLSKPPVVCAIYTDKPLLPEAWEYVGRLAKAASDASDRIAEIQDDHS